MQMEADVHRYVESWASGSELGVRWAHAFKAGSTSDYMTLSNSVLPFTTGSPAGFIRHKLLLPNPRVSNLIGQDGPPKFAFPTKFPGINASDMGQAWRTHTMHTPPNLLLFTEEGSRGVTVECIMAEGGMAFR